MIVHPEERVADFAKAGSDIISVHAEPAATVHLDRTIQQVHCRSKTCSTYVEPHVSSNMQVAMLHSVKLHMASQLCYD